MAARDVKPFKLPAGIQVDCEGVKPAGSMTLGDSERFLFDSFAQEHVRTSGTPMEFWSQDIEGSERDPLYDEPIVRKWAGPFKIVGYLQRPDSIPEAREEGIRQTFPSEMWVARKEFEDANAPPPKEGDVMRVWNLPFYADIGDGKGYFFDVIDSDEDGHLFDQASFVGFKLHVNRRTEFTPERRISPP